MQEASTAWGDKQKMLSRLQHLQGKFYVPSTSDGISFERQMHCELDWISESEFESEMRD